VRCRVRHGDPQAMNPNTTLEWILRLSASLDASIDGAERIDRDAVYTLVGLIEELDHWLASGQAPPLRWQAALRDGVAATAVMLETNRDASNDTVDHVSVRAPSRRRGLTRRSPQPATQLALPFASSGSR
jgi:hypothetical protein